MRVFIWLPTWLGDSVMASGAINLIQKSLPGASFVFFGSNVSCELYEGLGEQVVRDKSKKSSFKTAVLLKELRGLGEFDMAFSFRGSFGIKNAFCH